MDSKGELARTRPNRNPNEHKQPRLHNKL